VSGVDLTQEALDNLSNRIRAYNLPSPEKILVGDAENLPFEEDSFDLGYSFGVLHHSPDTEQAFRELVRVIRPGGELKVMLYNRHSVYVCGQWTKHALLRGRPWKSLSWILWNHVESRGTKGYTRRDLRRILTGLPLEAIRVHTEVTSADYLSASTVLPLNRFFRLCLRAAGVHFDWHPSRYVSPLNTHQKASDSASSPRSIIFTGNSLGFYHCITARKVAG
jgi:SAM-dependent methyltransferase